jgi:hypothetical protein
MKTSLSQGSGSYTSSPSMDSPEGAGPNETEERITLDREKQILTWVQEQYKMCKNARVSFEKQWQMNLAFYMGRQNVTVLNTAAASNGFKLHVPKAPPWRVRLVINKIRPIIRTELAKVTSQRPRFTVVPATSEDKDQISARVSEQIFDTVYSEKNVKHLVRRAEWWTLICGTGFIKNYWDTNKYDPYAEAQGDFCIEPWSPFHIFVPDLREEELENQPYVIHAFTKSSNFVRNAFPRLRNLDLTTTPSANDILDDSFLGIIGANATKKDEVLVLEVWIKPGGVALFPSGGLITVVGEHVVQIKDGYPYKHMEYPFSKLEHMPSGKFYADSIITDLIPIQRQYNRRRSQLVEAANLLGKPKLVAPRGSVNAAQITSEPGQVIFYTPGFDRPTALDLPNIPAYVMNEIQQLQQDMDDMAGQHEISRGQNPSQVTAATALSFLKEQDDTKLAGTIESLEIGMEKLGRHILSHVVQFWTTPRLVRVVGADQTFDAKKYSAKDIGSNLDVRVEAGSALPQSKAAKQAFVMDLLKGGWIPPEKGLEMLEIGGVERVYEDYLVDVRQTQRENMRMLDGEQVPPNDYDNHQLHIEIHNKFRKGQQYEALPQELKEVFHMHIQLHQQALQQGLMSGGVMPPVDPATGMPLQPGPPTQGGPPQQPQQQAPPGLGMQ